MVSEEIGTSWKGGMMGISLDTCNLWERYSYFRVDDSYYERTRFIIQQESMSVVFVSNDSAAFHAS